MASAAELEEAANELYIEGQVKEASSSSAGEAAKVEGDPETIGRVLTGLANYLAVNQAYSALKTAGGGAHLTYRFEILLMMMNVFTFRFC